jgi:hypothetical protein
MHARKIFSGRWMPIAALTAWYLSSGVAAAQNTLPAPWQQTDIGDVGLAGSASQGPDGDFFINGAGSDIWGTADSFHFVYQAIEDGRIDTNGPSLEDTNQFAKIGVMFRQTLDPGSPNVILDVKPDGGVEFMTRATANGQTTFIAGVDSSAGRTLHLVRANGIVTAMICGVTCQTVGSTPFVDGPVFVGAVITSHDPTVLNHGGFQGNLPRVLLVPDPWASYDYNQNTIGLRGSAYFQHGTLSVQASGADIWGTSDGYHFVQNSLVGDGIVTARVTSEQADNPYAKAGVIAVWGDQTVILDTRPNGQIEFMARPVQGGAMSFIAGSAASFPVWLKLERVGDQFTGFISPDGSTWQSVGSTSVSMNHGIYAGLAVTSHDVSALNTSTFDNVEVDSIGGFSDLDIGDVGAPGNFQDDGGGHLFINGAGADIWGTQDAFNFWYSGLSGDGEMSIRVMAIQNTSPFAKAGVMFRDSTDPSSAHVILDVRPTGDIEFMTRSAQGAATTFLAGASSTFPIYLSLTRIGSTVTAAMSQDGSTWTEIGSTSVNLGPVLKGLAVTSHQRGVLASGYFNP